MNEEKEETMVINLPRHDPPKKRYWRIHDFFIREWNWPEQMLKYPKETINLKVISYPPQHEQSNINYSSSS